MRIQRSAVTVNPIAAINLSTFGETLPIMQNPIKKILGNPISQNNLPVFERLGNRKSLVMLQDQPISKARALIATAITLAVYRNLNILSGIDLSEMSTLNRTAEALRVKTAKTASEK